MYLYRLILVVTRAQDPVVSSIPVADRYLSDHASVLCSLNAAKPSHVTKEICYRRLKAIEVDQLRADLLDVLLPVITKIINLSFESSVFADDWKEALVLPSSKKHGLDIAYKNFRPVSNLRYISKLSEKAAAVQLTDHMTTNKLHLLLQSAYKEHHSTESALLKVKNDILMNMDAQKVTLLVLLDLSAA